MLEDNIVNSLLSMFAAQELEAEFIAGRKVPQRPRQVHKQMVTEAPSPREV